MIQRMGVRLMAGVVVVAIALAGSAMAASIPVVQAIATEDGLIGQAPGYGIIEHFSSYKKSQYLQIAPEVRELRGLISRAARSVATAAVASTGQKTARADWVEGAHLTASAMGDVASELQDVAKGKQIAGAAQGKVAARLIAAGHKLTRKADSLLGLPTSL